MHPLFFYIKSFLESFDGDFLLFCAYIYPLAIIYPSLAIISFNLAIIQPSLAIILDG